MLISLFMKNETIIAYGSAFLRGFCLGIVFLSIDFLAVGVFQALGLGRYALVFAIMRKVVLEIPALIILNRLFPLYSRALRVCGGVDPEHLCGCDAAAYFQKGWEETACRSTAVRLR